LFGSPAAIVDQNMAKTRVPGSATDAELIVREALSAFGHGVARAPVDPAAVHTFRSHFIPKICAALEQPGWADAWRREQAYVAAYAEEMGRHAARLAADGGRAAIAPADVDDARARLRGWMPVAGRWCPL
jgi:hypothetical protein